MSPEAYILLLIASFAAGMLVYYLALGRPAP